MAIIYTYTKVTPQPLDSMVITDVDNKNFTKTALIGEAVNESIAAGTNICLGWGSNTGITTINSASYSFEGIYEPQFWEVKLNKDLCGLASTVDILKFIITPVNGTDVISTGEPLDYDTSNPDVWNLTQFAYGGGGNVGYVPAGGDVGEYLDGGTGLWTTLPADQNTTYDLTAAADVTTPANMNILLNGSDTTVDTVTLVPGTNITMTDLGSNQIQIEAATGGYSWDVSGGSNTYTVSNAEKVKFTGAGGISVSCSADPNTGSPYTVNIDGSGISPGTGTVTKVGANTNVSVASSGLSVSTTPSAGITSTGDVDLKWSGSVGDLLTAESDGSGGAILTKLAISTNSGDVLTSNGSTASWQTPSTPPGGCSKAIGEFTVTAGNTVTVDNCGETIAFASGNNTVEITGTNTAGSKSIDLEIKNLPCASSVNNGGIKVNNTLYTGSIEAVSSGKAYPVQVNDGCEAVVRIPASSAPSDIVGTFEPIMVEQGFDGTGSLQPHTYVNSMINSTGRYRVSGGIAYIEFYVEFDGAPNTYLLNTLGVAIAAPQGSRDPVLGLETLNGLANLPTNNDMNACVTIADCGLKNVSDINGIASWRRAVVGGKLNKFYGLNPDKELKSVIWLMNGGSANTSGIRQSPTWGVQPSPTSGDYWLQFTNDAGNPYVAGSLTISLNQ